MTQSKGKAIAAMILGIVSCVCCFCAATIFLGVVGIVCGIIALCFAVSERKKAEELGVKPDAITTVALITGIAGLALCAIFTISCVACYAVSGSVADRVHELPWDEIGKSMPDDLSDYLPNDLFPGI